MTNVPHFDAHDPEQQAAWRQWVTDSIVWIQEQVKHLHDCIERRTSETKDLVAQKAASAEELAESRHQQNIETLQRIDQTVQMLTSFRENATQKEIEEQAVAAERRRLAEEKARRRSEFKSTAWKAAEYAGAGTIVTLAFAGIVAIARTLGL
jgi:hypothetical protein